MKIAVASGKGGTGKTTVAVALALASSDDTQILDCDVEAPNCHIFLKPDLYTKDNIAVKIPLLDESKCDGCGKCSAACEYRAIAMISDKPMIFSELCHSCGACAYVCPERALTETARIIGTIEAGSSGGIAFFHGRLNIGEPMAPPLIRELRRRTGGGFTIIDCPPGTSCPVVTAVTGADYTVLVTEPTPFGLNDLKLAIEMVSFIRIPFGVVINRSGTGDSGVKDFCAAGKIELLAEIPDDMRIAVAYSKGLPIFEAAPELKSVFGDMLLRITKGAVQ